MDEISLDKYLREYSVIEEIFYAIPAYSMSLDDLEIFKHYQPKFVGASERGNVDKVKQLIENYTNVSDIVFPQNQHIMFLTHERFAECEAHKHAFIEMFYVYSGSCTTIINGISVTMNKGDVCILDTNTIHSIEVLGEDDIVINCLMKTQYFNATFLGRIAQNDLLAGFFINAIYQNCHLSRFILFQHSDASRVHDVFRKMLCEYHDKNPCYIEVVDSYIVILFAELLRGFSNTAVSEAYKGPSDFNVSAVIQYVQENCDEATLTGTAEHFNYEPVYMSKMIKRFSNQTFTGLKIEARLIKSRLLLENTTMKINQIANEIGYANIHFFYEIFKKKYGLTPAEYRRNHKKDR